MDISDAILKFGSGLVLPLLIGWLLRGRMPISDAVLDRIMAWNLYLLVTGLGVLSMWVLVLDRSLIWIPLIAVASSLVAGVAGMGRARLAFNDAASRGAFVVSAMISNRNTAGTLTVFLLLGEAGYAHSRLFVAVNWPFLFLVVYPVAGWYQQRMLEANQADASDAAKLPKRKAMRGWKLLLNLNNIPILGLVVGLCLNASGLHRPAAFADIVPWLVFLNMWLFLVPLGYSIDVGAIRGQRLDWLGIFAIKFVLTPLAAFAMGWAAGLSPIALATVVILAFSPSAIQAVLGARIFGLNHHLAMGIFVITMAGFLLLAVPVIAAAFVWFDLFRMLTP